MSTYHSVFAFVVPISTAVVVSLLLVRGEICSTMIRADMGDGFVTLRTRAFADFRAECCTPREHQLDEIQSCSFRSEPAMPQRYKFVLGPLAAPFWLNFTVKTREDAFLGLAESTTEASMFVEINIGGYANTFSSIRACHSSTCGDNLATHSEAGLLSVDANRPFWVDYEGGIVRVGKGGQEAAFLVWDAGAHHGRVPANAFVGVASWEHVAGDWVFYNYCELMIAVA